MLNQVNLVGRLARDPEISKLDSGIKKGNLVVAVERNYKSKNGEQKTDFIYVTLWGRLAEQCNKFLSKGRMIAMQGRVEVNSWNDKESGKRKYRTGIVAKEVKFLDNPKSNQAGDNEATA